ncbi:MAG: ATP-binding protein [Deltaproteobacteria bacterium]|nr:ATP-binding protein [Deltaproteobacteria bacterium]
MYRKEVNEQSPLRILEQSIHGGLGKGNLGVVMSRAGVGKTACLIQVGLDDLLRDRDVFHVALGQTLEHVQSWYDALFDDLATRTQLDERESVRAAAWQHRVIKAFADHQITPSRLEKAIGMFEEHMKFRPSAILIDGFHWEGPDDETRSALKAFRAQAKRLGAELWISAQTHRATTGEHPTQVTPPCEAFADLIDVAIFLEPHGDHVDIRLLKDHGDAVPPVTHLHFHPDTMRLVTDEEEHSLPKLPISAYSLLSGGAAGAEAEFGACAERWRIGEVNFSFEGRAVERTRGLVPLGEAELRQGDVSSAYLTAHMHRTYPETPLFRKILQSIWHQVNSAGEVFAVGQILPDNTVKGGTGWAVELARHWEKPVHVFDQERKGWFSWKGGKWVDVVDPVISRTRFTGTGTRFLTAEGRAAIRALFTRSFGPPLSEA